MSPATVRTLLCLLLTLIALILGVAGLRPLKPTNVKLTVIDEGLQVTWEPPEELDSSPVDWYNIGYGTSMKALRFVKVDKDERSRVLEDVEPGVLHFLKMTAENADGMSKPVYKAETPKAKSQERRRPAEEIRERLDSPRNVALGSNRGYLLGLAQSDHRLLDKPRPLGRRSQRPHQLASESVYVVSLQAQNAPRQSSSAYSAVMTKKKLAEPEELPEVKDITVRVNSAQSVMVSWVDPATERERSSDDSREWLYTVRYREKGESARWDYKETPQRRLLVDGLYADNMYEFSVRISEGLRHGPWSASVFQRTPESAPTGPPTNFHVKPFRGKGTAVTATWEPPEEPNGRIREYILTYAPALKPFGAKSITYPGSQTSANIDGLQPGNSYIFKIRAVNRRGQGPSTKAFSIAMPGTSAVVSSQKTKSQEDDRSSHLSSRTSKQSSKDSKDGGLQSTEDTDEPAPYSPKTVNPMARRSRPLSQSRSYHSVFSSARSLVRNGAAGSNSPLQDKRDQNNKDHTSHKESSDELDEDLDEEDTENREQTVTQNNDKSSSKNSAYGADTSPHDTSPSRSHATPVKLWPGSVPRVPFHTRIIPASSQTISMESVKPRRPLPTPTRKSTTHDASPEPKTERVGTSSPSSNNQDVSLTRKDNTANAHPDKESLQITPNQETSSKLNQAPSIQTQGGNHQTGSGLVLSRRKPFGPMRNTSRVFHGQRKPISSSAVSQSTLPTGIQNPQSSSHALIRNDVKVEGNNQDYKDTKGVIKDERPTAASHASTSHALSSPVSKDGKDGQESRTKEYNYGSYPSSRTNSGTSMGRGYRLGVSNRTLPRVPSSRDKSAPSVGANRPVLKETSSHSGISVPHQTSDLLPSKHLSTSGASKPSFPNWSSVLSGSANSVKSPSSRGNTDSSDSTTKKSGSENSNDNSDNVHHGNKETSEKNYKITTTSAPQSTTSAASKASRPQSNDNESIDRNSSPRKASSSVPLLPRRPLVGPNGRFRSTLLQNRQLSLRLPTRLLPSQHTQSGTISESSRLPSSSGTGASSHLMSSQSPHSASRQTSSEGAGPSSVAKQSQPSDTSLRQPIPGTRLRYPSRMDISSRGKKNGNEQGKNGRPNLTVANGKDAPTSDNSNKPGGQRIITGPEGTKWIVDLNKGLLMNENGQILQDSEGRPHRVVLGEDGQTIFDSQGSPLVNQEGLALFGHGRDSRPVVNPKDKMLTLGGKPLIGLDRPKLRTTTVKTTTTELTTLPTTTEMTTVEPTMKLTVEPTTLAVHPTCPPGTYSKSDARGLPLLDADGILNCYPEEGPSGMDVDAVLTVPVSTHRPGTLAVVEEDFVVQTTLASTTAAPVIQPATKPLSSGPSSTFDAAGNERFTAPYVSYIRKDPGAPCSLTEALEYVQVDVLENLLAMDNQAHNLPPRNKPHNITVVAMEGCHSFVILDWARPLKDDMVSGYMVYSASYDDVLSNRWSSMTSTGTHLPVENLKPNSRYYFKVQAKNIFGMGPISDTLTYVTESDDPLLIERPPGGEPIWIPFSFKYNTAQSTCKGSQFVKRTWYRKFVGVVLCNSLRYKIFMGEGLKDTFYSIGDTFGFGEDHCQFVDSYLEGRTGPHSLSEFLPTTQGFYRSYRQEPVRFGPIGQRTPHTFVGWYECGVPIPGKW